MLYPWVHIKISDLAEHAYQIKPSGIGSHILASSFIEGIDNPYVRKKLDHALVIP